LIAVFYLFQLKECNPFSELYESPTAQLQANGKKLNPQRVFINNHNKQKEEDCYLDPYEDYVDSRMTVESNLRHPRGMCFVSHTYKFIYINIPKVASTTMKALLTKLNVSGSRNYNRLPDDVKNYFTFAFVRDPYERFYSAYGTILERGVQQGHQATKNKPFYKISDPEDKFRKFVEDTTKQLWDEHIQRQLYYLTLADGNLVPLDFVGKLETFDEDWKFIQKELKLPDAVITRVPVLNQQRVWTRVNYTDELIVKALCDLYAQDYLCFDFDFPEPCVRLYKLSDRKEVFDRVNKKKYIE